MNGTFTFNVIGAPNSGFGAGNRATTTGEVRVAKYPIDPRYLRITSGASQCTRSRLVSCIEIKLFGRTF